MILPYLKQNKGEFPSFVLLHQCYLETVLIL